MRKTVQDSMIGMVAVSALTMLAVVNAAEKKDMNQFVDLDLDITEDVSASNELDDMNLTLPVPETPQVEQNAAPAPAKPVPAASAPEKELNIAQNPAPITAAPAIVPAEVPADEGNVSNVLAEPAVETSNVNAPAANANPTDVDKTLAEIKDVLPSTEAAPANAEDAAPEKTPVPEAAPVTTAEEKKEPEVQQLPPVEQSIMDLNGKEAATENAAPVETIDPTVEAAVPAQTVENQAPAMAGRGNMLARGGAAAPCPPVEREVTGTRRPIHYGIQRNGLAGYPRAGNCPDGPCCPGGFCGGRPHRAPMEYPYYTLRGPRDFDDPNPRPIGP